MASSSEQERAILVVGDVMIDNSWPLVGQATATTSQAHFGVEPVLMATPQSCPEVLGGAGTVARAIKTVAASEQRVILAGAWPDGLSPDELLPDEAKPIEFVQLAHVPFLTTKWRLFRPTLQGHELVARYDRDLSSASQYRPSTSPNWPEPSEVAVVIVADFAKGLLDIEDVREKLQEYASSNIPLLLRAKREGGDSLLREVPWTVLLPNRRDLELLLNQEYSVRRPAIWSSETDDAQDIHPDLVKSIRALTTTLPWDSTRALLIKLDADGAVLVRGDGDLVEAFHLTQKGKQEWSAIGAGDVLMASMALEIQAQRELPEAVLSSVKLAAAFTSKSGHLSEMEGWLGFSTKIPEDAVENIAVKTGESRSLTEHEDALLKASEPRHLLRADASVQLHHSQWYLKGFCTVDSDLGRELARLASELRKYTENATQNSKPFVTAICGGPGAGKSTVARALAAAAGCKIREANVAQWSSIEDLHLVCEHIRSLRVVGSFPLVFIDEVDSQIASQPIYGWLLAPIWDGTYSARGEMRHLGPTAFLLAGSSGDWERRELLLATQGTRPGERKLKDLVSRLSVPPVDLSPLERRKADAVYLAITILRAAFPSAREVQLGVLRLLAESKRRHGPRSIVQVIQMIGPLASENRISVKDVRARARQLEVHFESVPENWQSHTEWVAVEP